MALRGRAPGRDIAGHIALPFSLTAKLLFELKERTLVTFKDSAVMGDYVYEITEAGLCRARELTAHSSYCGATPVPLAQYVAGVAAQTLQALQPGREILRRAFSDMVLDEAMFARLCRAIICGKGLFLHGLPGNGKTCIAERICRAYGSSVWIPRAVSVDGEIIQLYDPSCHQPVPLTTGNKLLRQESIDARWIQIERPTIVVGGELTIRHLDIEFDRDLGFSQAPVQMKSNCGVLVVDDFGRQRIAPAELLNRWIIPLEKRVDYLTLPSGRKICVPFEQLVVFSTNLEPKDLVDEAFLRRIPYKINVDNPKLDEFQCLLRQMCEQCNVAYSEQAAKHLVLKHYDACGRTMRFCHPRDLVQQVAIYCKSLEIPPALSCEALDAVARDYFSIV